MRDPAQHLSSLSDSLESLDSFLHSDQIFWTRGGLPSLSLGGIYWDRLVLTAVRDQLVPEDHRRFDELEREVDRVADQRRVAWEAKAAGEARSRLNLWRAYLTDLAERPGEARSYSNEVRNRLLAGYLVEQAGKHPDRKALRSQLDTLDKRLSGRFEANGFVWEAELSEMLPEENYWYLYGQPRARR